MKEIRSARMKEITYFTEDTLKKFPSAKEKLKEKLRNHGGECPFCHSDLYTSSARQCPSCLMDWHNIDNPKKLEGMSNVLKFMKIEDYQIDRLTGNEKPMGCRSLGESIGDFLGISLIFSIPPWVISSMILHFWKGFGFMDTTIIAINLLIGTIISLLGKAEHLSYHLRCFLIRRKNRGLFKEVNHYNQIIDKLITLNQLSSVGNIVPIAEPQQVIDAFDTMRTDLERALKTERILRENPQFNPENFSIDLKALQALQINERSKEYATILNEALQMEMNVQEEMKKLF